MSNRSLGLIVNPVAGLGGRVGLKGSDGAEIQRRALELGAVPQAGLRARQALKPLQRLQPGLDIVTYPAEMGEDAAREAGYRPRVIGTIVSGATTAQDTRRAARDMRRLQVDLLLFSGGDGTARDVAAAVGEELPALGIPAGVKIHSAVFATSPASAGEISLGVLLGRHSSFREGEVMDIDEEAYRQGVLSARLYGYLQVPYYRGLVQGAKALSAPGDAGAQRGIARRVAAGMEQGCLYIIGPGSTTRALAAHLRLQKTLLGVDVVLGGELLAADANESQLLALLEGRKARIVVTPIGGQGFIFGRGNQQISPQVIETVGRDNVIVVSTPGKLHGLGGQPLRVDTGDPAVDEMLSGYIRVVTGHDEEVVYRVTA
jgi:predicted polyphosphate/ATP-dependent NAD kinase